MQLYHNFGFPPVADKIAPPAAVAAESQEIQGEASQLAGIDFDLDMFDWSVWEEMNKNAGPLATTR